MDLPLPQAQRLIQEIRSALSEASPQRAQAAAVALDDHIRRHDWSSEQLSTLRELLHQPLTAGADLRQKLLTELRGRRQTRGHLSQYQRVEQGY